MIRKLRKEQTLSRCQHPLLWSAVSAHIDQAFKEAEEDDGWRRKTHLKSYQKRRRSDVSIATHMLVSALPTNIVNVNANSESMAVNKRGPVTSAEQSWNPSCKTSTVERRSQRANSLSGVAERRGLTEDFGRCKRREGEENQEQEQEESRPESEQQHSDRWEESAAESEEDHDFCVSTLPVDSSFDAGRAGEIESMSLEDATEDKRSTEVQSKMPTPEAAYTPLSTATTSQDEDLRLKLKSQQNSAEEISSLDVADEIHLMDASTKSSFSDVEDANLTGQVLPAGETRQERTTCRLQEETVLEERNLQTVSFLDKEQDDLNGEDQAGFGFGQDSNEDEMSSGSDIGPLRVTHTGPIKLMHKFSSNPHDNLNLKRTPSVVVEEKFLHLMERGELSDCVESSNGHIDAKEFSLLPKRVLSTRAERYHSCLAPEPRCRSYRLPTSRLSQVSQCSHTTYKRKSSMTWNLTKDPTPGGRFRRRNAFLVMILAALLAISLLLLQSSFRTHQSVT